MMRLLVEVVVLIDACAKECVGRTCGQTCWTHGQACWFARLPKWWNGSTKISLFVATSKAWMHPAEDCDIHDDLLNERLDHWRLLCDSIVLPTAATKRHCMALHIWFKGVTQIVISKECEVREQHWKCASNKSHYGGLSLTGTKKKKM